jgi:intracellular septation protein A
VTCTASPEGVLHLGSLRAHARHAFAPLVEGVVGPCVVFYVTLLLGGFRAACLAALVWSYAAVARRLARRERLPGTLLVGTLLFTLRTAIALGTGSAFLYFVQPTASTYLVALVFVGSALAGRPLIERFAQDFCPIDPALFHRPFVRRFFVRVSLLWAVVMFVNATYVLWLLLASPLAAFYVERTVASAALTAGGVVLSVLWFRRDMQRNGLRVHFGSPRPVEPALVPMPALAEVA